MRIEYERGEESFINSSSMDCKPNDLPEPEPPKIPMWGYCCISRISKMKGTPFWSFTEAPSNCRATVR